MRVQRNHHHNLCETKKPDLQSASANAGPWVVEAFLEAVVGMVVAVGGAVSAERVAMGLAMVAT